ncbi:MAG: DNA polymerase III subunit delta [Deltaproteobacteria bacterium]|nr:MAG: DNA polymerase III subunit delta [Deltaproteobacteria bacterium]
MPAYYRDTIDALLADARQEPACVYLFFGERYLCRDAMERLEQVLLEGGGTVHPIDGDSEDINATIARLRSFSLLPGRQVYRITDSRLFHSKNVCVSLWNRALKAKAADRQQQASRYLWAMLEAGGLEPEEQRLSEIAGPAWQKAFGFARPTDELYWADQLLAEHPPASTPSGKDTGAQLEKALKAGLPANNLLLLQAEEVDKRKKLFKYFKTAHTLVDLSVEQGASTRARNAQNAVLADLVNATLARFGKTIEPRLMERLLERVGFHPVAAVTEAEKLCLGVGDAPRIDQRDLDALVGRTRQEALFELTGAFGEKDLAQALGIAQRLQENGTHSLAIVATLRNHVRALLLCRALQEQPESGFRPSISAGAFQRDCLPRLKGHEIWGKEFSGHPYAVFMQFKTAAGFSLGHLSRCLRLLLTAELRLKGSPVDARTVISHLLIEMLTRKGPAQPG